MLKHFSLLFSGFFLGMMVFNFINFQGSHRLSESMLCGLLGVVVVYILFYSNKPLNLLFNWKKYVGVRLLLGIVWNTASAFLVIWICVLIYGTLVNNTSLLNGMNMEEGLKLAILLLCISIIYNIIYFVLYSYNQYTTVQLLALKTERKQAQLQLATLKSQLSPHFLFNCINSLSVLFYDDRVKAENFIRSMAKSYTYTLENCRQSLIAVKKELEFLESYTFLLRTRFNDAFKLKVDLDEMHLQSKLPPLTLQLLVENAIKHNKVNASEPIVITITGNKTSLVISNNKVKKPRALPSSGVGLKNIDNRYRILSRHTITVSDEEQFTITLPLLTDE